MSPNDPTSNLRPLSPYPLVQVRKSNDISTPFEDSIIYKFTTDKGYVYNIIFKPDASYLPGSVIANFCFSLIIQLIEGLSDALDIRIRDTVVYALTEAFRNNPDLIINYQCSSEDEKEYKRAMKFSRWLQDFGQDFEAQHYSGGSKTFATAIHRKDNPYSPLIATTFREMFWEK